MVNLTGRLNNGRKISPKITVQLKDLGKQKNSLQPTCQFGFIVWQLQQALWAMKKQEKKHEKNPGVLLLEM